MLRLDPAFPPLWRTASILQFGGEPVALLDDPAPWVLQLLHELERGVPDDALPGMAACFGAPPGGGRELLRRIRPALMRPHADPRPLVSVRVGDGFDDGDVDAFARMLGLVAAVGSVHGVERVLHAPDPAGTTVVLLAHHLVDPRHAAALLRSDTPHLAVVHAGRRATVGPLVRPGRTACLACLESARRDADPDWPFLGAQLIGRTAGSPGPALSAETGIVTGRLLSGRSRTDGLSVTVSADSARRRHRRHRPHAACGCRSLGGTATADVSRGRATTTPTAIAQPA